MVSINNAQLTNDGVTNDDANDYFGMELLYNANDASLGNTPNYNGNISAAKWKGPGFASGTTDQRSYKYSYDKSDKLKTATFQANAGSAWTKEVNTLNETLTYDHNGNILNLTRNQNQRTLSGTTVLNNAQTIDNLTYTYATGNQLSKVEDGATSAGFNNGVNNTTEYTYDGTGSLTKDDNKGIASITYNVLNKPQQITFSNGSTIVYTYDVSGTKLKVATTVGGATTTTDYVGGYMYTNNALTFFSSPEGRVVKNGSNYEYQYAISDHQGNTRVVFSSVAPAAQPVTATFEGDAKDQSSQFTNVTAISSGTSNHTPGGNKVVRLSQSSPVGPGFSKAVYPGDAIDMEAYSYYTSTSGYTVSNLSVATLISSVTTALVAGGPDLGGLKASGVNSALTNIGVGANQGDGAPASFLNYILFDKNYSVVDAGWQVITATPNSKERVFLPQIKVTVPGYIFVYLSYEDASDNAVDFDDFKVTVTPTNVIQSNEYYAFNSSAMNSWTRDNAVQNNFLANGGTEANTTSSLYDLDYRNFDPILGRMNGVDMMADYYSSNSPYHYSFNNPILFSDPNGADPITTWDEFWNVLGTLWNGTPNENDSGGGGLGTWTANGGYSYTDFGSVDEAKSWAGAYQSQQSNGGGGSIVASTTSATTSGGYKYYTDTNWNGHYWYDPGGTTTTTTYSWVPDEDDQGANKNLIVSFIGYEREVDDTWIKNSGWDLIKANNLGDALTQINTITQRGNNVNNIVLWAHGNPTEIHFGNVWKGGSGDNLSTQELRREGSQILKNFNSILNKASGAVVIFGCNAGRELGKALPTYVDFTNVFINSDESRSGKTLTTGAAYPPMVNSGLSEIFNYGWYNIGTGAYYRNIILQMNGTISLVRPPY